MNEQVLMSTKLFMLLALLACFAIASALAQTNLPVTACGMPAGGVIFQTVTYTLSANCELTSQINIATAPMGDPPIAVTINGGGYRISGGSFTFFLGPKAVLNLNDVTIYGGNIERTHIVSAGSVNANRVTLTSGYRGPAISADQTNLNNVLFTSNYHGALSLLGRHSSALQARKNSSHTLTDVVFRNNERANGAVTLLSGSTLTTEGCLTLSGNVPYDIYDGFGGTWTDNSTGPCTGSIGNGHQAAIPAPQLMACGFPAAGNLDASATYRLSADCKLTGVYFISEHVDIRVIGNGRAIRTSRSGYSFKTAATSSLLLQNVALEGIRFLHWGDFRAGRIRVTDTDNGFMYNLGEARFSNALFEGNSTTIVFSVVLAHNPYENGFTNFTDVTFRDNTGGRGALVTFGSIIELNGCIHFENNSEDIYIFENSGGAITDNRDPDCDDVITDPVSPPSQPDKPKRPAERPRFHPSIIGSQRDLSNCDLPLGAIGVICRPKRQPPIATVWRVRPDSDGIFLFGLTQAQVEAAAGIVACSEDGRAAVRVGLPDELLQIFSQDPNYREELKVARRYIVFSKGPTAEGKVHNVVLDNSLDGRVFGTVDTFGGPPAPECAVAPATDTAEQASEETAAEVKMAPMVRPQSAQPDGSIIHSVGAGDTLSAIAIAYRASQREIIALNQLSGTGDMLTVGQALLIRAAPE